MPELYAHLSRQEATALFRANIIGALATRELDRGELKAELRALSAKRFRPPGAKVTRCFSVPTLERWLYAYRHRGLEGLYPRRRKDAGRGRALEPDLKKLLIDIRSEYPTASVPLILRTLELAHVIEPGTVKPQTVRRLFRQAGLPRR